MTRRLVPLAILAIAAAYLWAATRVPLDPWSADEAVNARTFPLACGALLALFAAGLSLRGVPLTAGAGRYGPLAAIVGCILAFIVAIPFIGLCPRWGSSCAPPSRCSANGACRCSWARPSEPLPWDGHSSRRCSASTSIPGACGADPGS